MQSTFAPSGAHGRSALPLEDLLDPHRCAFFFDVDGTLIDIAIHPDAVSVPKSLLDTLEALDRETGGALALVSGRSIAGLDTLFKPMRLAASGVHGCEMRLSPDAEMVLQSPVLEESLRSGLVDLVHDLDGVLVEDKGTSVAIHYRLNPDIGPQLRTMLQRYVADAGEGVTLLPGRLVFEVKRASHDKGSAVRQFMETAAFAGRTPVFMGDDVTDEAAFAVVNELGGVVVSVGRDLPIANVVLPEAEDVRVLLARLAETARRD
ncbi:trehalose-phosphatase [Xanthobacteraceae bacterium A53D]